MRIEQHSSKATVSAPILQNLTLGRAWCSPQALGQNLHKGFLEAPGKYRVSCGAGQWGNSLCICQWAPPKDWEDLAVPGLAALDTDQQGCVLSIPFSLKTITQS